jgi:ATP-dependent DNA helicase RecG
MAPTEILAMQHFESIKTIMNFTDAKISLYTRNIKTLDQTTDVIIGTHALLYRSLENFNPAFLVIDEQHRFGVEQRSQLRSKLHPPHLLTMTATPIPRTVALTFFGDLDLSLLNEMPPGRIPIKTWVVSQEKRIDAYEWILKRCQSGDQAFIICPLIEVSGHESIKQVKAATQEYEFLKKGPLKPLKLGLLHGKMPVKEKQSVLAEMRQKKIDCLVATPVVEVGIDIPNATIMVVEGAERFGLAQIHQLRGRVGRSDKPSFCLLFPTKNSLSSSKRLKALESTASGLSLAELDLKSRGPGELYGTLQHGYSGLKFASLLDLKLIAKTRNYAQSMLSQDPSLSRVPLQGFAKRTLEKHIEPN